MVKLIESEQRRVASSLAPYILEFARGRLEQDRAEFHLLDLVNFVYSRETCSPNSPARILQMLKEYGQLDYEVVSRRRSLYRILECS